MKPNFPLTRRWKPLWRVATFTAALAGPALGGAAGNCLHKDNIPGGILGCIAAAQALLLAYCGAALYRIPEAAYRAAIPPTVRGGCSKCSAWYTEGCTDGSEGIIVWHDVSCVDGARMEWRIKESL